MAERSYRIHVAAELSGVRVELIRAWERRYGVVTPTRDERGRLYSDADVRRLQLLAAAVERGHAIGRIARAGDTELERLIARPALREALSALALAPVATARPRLASRSSRPGVRS